MPVKKFAYLFVFIIIFITTALSGFNYIVDPYMIYQSERVPGFNDKKPAAANRSTLYKPYNVSSIRPKTIIAGNSRPEMGIDPNSTCWPIESAPVYNFTFPGQGTYGQVRALFHAVADGQVENILLGVDFADFLHQRSRNKKVFWPRQRSEFYDRFLVDEEFNENKNYGLRRAKDFTVALFSLDALSDSFSTLMSQHLNSTNRTYSGFNPARDYQEIIEYEGAWVLFEQKKNELEKRFSKRGLSLYDHSKWSVELEAVKRLVQLAADKNIPLILFINPYHFTYLEIIRNAGYWHEFENFKKNLKDLLDQYGNGQVALWDFALYSNYTVSSIPQKKVDSKQFFWFWEPAHYKASLGELILAEIFDLNCVKDKKGPVGVQLNDVNIDAHLNDQQKQRSILLQQINLNSSPLQPL